ncbi:hypothetical protein, partial [Acetobacter pasteurianus]
AMSKVIYGLDGSAHKVFSPEQEGKTVKQIRLSPFNAWLNLESDTRNIRASIEVYRAQPDFKDRIRGSVGRLSLKLVAYLFRNEPGVRGRKDTFTRMVDALAPIFDGK